MTDVITNRKVANAKKGAKANFDQSLTLHCAFNDKDTPLSDSS